MNKVKLFHASDGNGKHVFVVLDTGVVYKYFENSKILYIESDTDKKTHIPFGDVIFNQMLEYYLHT